MSGYPCTLSPPWYHFSHTLQLNSGYPFSDSGRSYPSSCVFVIVIVKIKLISAPENMSVVLSDTSDSKNKSTMYNNN